jgi:metallo-beta-lactamase class B
MKLPIVSALGLLAGLGLQAVAQQAPTAAPPAGSYEAHLAAAKQAAGFEFPGTLARLCIAPATAVGGNIQAADRAQWYAGPAQVFDNLYWVGTRIHSAWALTDPQGIIILDTLFNYAVGPEIVEGLKSLHLDPKDIRYVIVTHGHGDHDEGARLLQDAYGAHVVLGAPDWDLIEQGPDMPGGKPRRDIVATDGQKITVGANTVTLLSTPGHTAGTLSMLFTVRDHGRPLTVVYSGGTAIAGLYQDPERLAQYIDSQHKLARAAADAHASVLMSNHSEFDGAYVKARLLAGRRPGEPHPYEVGAEAVQRYFVMTDECAQAARLRASGH